jgi:hypothetical protein
MPDIAPVTKSGRSIESMCAKSAPNAETAKAEEDVARTITLRTILRPKGLSTP